MPDEPTASEIQLRIRQLLGQATLLRSRGDLQQALALAQEAVSLDDESWEGQELVGDLLLSLAHPDQAMESYRRAREINPERASLEEKVGRAALAQAERDRTTELSRSLLEGKDALQLPKRNPSYAALYSFIIPGLGQVYNREVGKGVFSGVGAIWVVCLIVVWIYAVADAALRASKTMTSDHTGVV